ncbi:hypothetical protein ACO22_07773, partial [Paracoccidioides brasiliensis]
MRLDISESGRPSAQAGPSQAGRANLAENQGTLQATASLKIEDLAYESQHAEVSWPLQLLPQFFLPMEPLHLERILSHDIGGRFVHLQKLEQTSSPGGLGGLTADPLIIP